MQFKNWSELLQSDAWAPFAVQWKHALLNWNNRNAYGLNVESEVEALIVQVCNSCVAHNQYKIAFDRKRPILISFDGKQWEAIIKLEQMH